MLSTEEIWNIVPHLSDLITRDLAKALGVEARLNWHPERVYGPRKDYKFQLKDPMRVGFSIQGVRTPKELTKVFDDAMGALEKQLSPIKGKPVSLTAAVRQLAIDREENPMGYCGVVVVKVYSNEPPEEFLKPIPL